jgi:hypothetical protein
VSQVKSNDDERMKIIELKKNGDRGTVSMQTTNEYSNDYLSIA